MNITVRFLLLIPILIVSCNSIPLQTSKSSPSELKPGWKSVEAGGSFSFHLPSTMREQKVQGIDSYVGQYRNNNLQVSFDYGMYSAPMDKYSNEAEYKEIKKKIGGLDAVVIFFRQTTPASKHRYFAGVHFSHVGGDRNTGITRLTLHADFDRESDWETVQTIFESIRFK